MNQLILDDLCDHVQEFGEYRNAIRALYQFTKCVEEKILLQDNSLSKEEYEAYKNACEAFGVKPH